MKTQWMVMAASVALAGFIGVSIAQADEIVHELRVATAGTHRARRAER